MGLLGEDTQFVKEGKDPYAPPHKKRRRIPVRLLAVLGAGLIVVLCCAGTYVIVNVANAAKPGPTSTPQTNGTLPAPGMTSQGPVATWTMLPTDTSTALSSDAFFTQEADHLQPSETASPTASPTVAGTSCAASGEALTEIACNGLSLNETLQAAQPGTPINASGIDLSVTTVYVYPTIYPPTQTPWIIQASATQTPVVITATPGPTQTPWIQVTVITAVPGATQTPWFYITQPPVVTVMWTQLVTVIVPVTVVVTATPTDTLQPSETPQPTETPTP